MPLFTKDTLERIRQRVDLVDLVGRHIDLKAAGASYKALCPFHDEKTPSFHIQRGDSHYHCFGCGAHGDAIQFLMAHQQLSFPEAVERLAEQAGLAVEYETEEQDRGPNKRKLKEALDHACRFYQTMLLYSEEGRAALRYLYDRGIDLDFVRRFRVGLAPKQGGIFRKVMGQLGVTAQQLLDAGLVVEREGRGLRDFFYDRITFPVCDATGAVIGFSARKYKEETFGGKYVNTSETELFKKWKVLFGLHHCRRHIARDGTAIIVEGQVDALRLIQEGIECAVAGQGTAFGEGQVEPLVQLGVRRVYLALDADDAGLAAASKLGRLFQKRGIDVKVAALPEGEDPDSFLQRWGPHAFMQLIEEGEEYLAFLLGQYSREIDASTPAGKNELVARVAAVVREWDDPVMVYESLRRLSVLTGVPEHMIGVGEERLPNIYYRRSDVAGVAEVDPDLVLESDFLRWFVAGTASDLQLCLLGRRNVPPEKLRNASCRELYLLILAQYDAGRPCDVSTLANLCSNVEMREVLEQLLQRRVNLQRQEALFPETMQKILNREWMMKCEELNRSIISGQLSEDEQMKAVRRFGELKRNPPELVLDVESRDCSEEVASGQASALL